MKCGRLHLQDRFKPRVKPDVSSDEKKHLRYCQKRMVNPQHEEDPRWTDVYERFHCNADSARLTTTDSARGTSEAEDLCLTVQTLRFHGDVEQTKKSRTSFKYKLPTDGATHRMFVKQAVQSELDDGRTSQLTCYYFDDYVKYLFNSDKSRPTSGKSSIFLQGLSNKREKTTQVDAQTDGHNHKASHKLDSKVNVHKNIVKPDEQDIAAEECAADDTKITYRKSGKRKSLTISRTQSPETVQVIRVDVVCTYSTSSLSDYDKKQEGNNLDSTVQNVNLRGSHFADKYLLTNTIKKLDERLSGAKVTLLCKTFKLSQRAAVFPTNKQKANSDEKYKSQTSKQKSGKYKAAVKTKTQKQIQFL